jgi:magnesium transporter
LEKAGGPEPVWINKHADMARARDAMRYREHLAERMALVGDGKGGDGGAGGREWWKEWKQGGWDSGKWAKGKTKWARE